MASNMHPENKQRLKMSLLSQVPTILVYLALTGYIAGIYKTKFDHQEQAIIRLIERADSWDAEKGKLLSEGTPRDVDMLREIGRLTERLSRVELALEKIARIEAQVNYLYDEQRKRR